MHGRYPGSFLRKSASVETTPGASKLMNLGPVCVDQCDATSSVAGVGELAYLEHVKRLQTRYMNPDGPRSGCGAA
jgi:hypothetical protein